MTLFLLVFNFQKKRNIHPRIINKIPDAKSIFLLSILSDNLFPKYTVIMDKNERASMVPIKTMSGLYSAANKAAAIWVLSPSSDMNTNKKAAINRFLLFSCSYFSLSRLIKMIRPKTMKTIADNIFKYIAGITADI